MTTITCKIPDALNASLEAEARQRRRSKSEIVRQALQQSLRQSMRKHEPRAYDLARRLCGSLHGPKDLSTNPRHLEGLGD
jgi:Arc/MetJ-type ribon-helix-helix transcriptional regulator